MPDHDPTAIEPHVPRHTRYGLVLFALYLAFYAGFVLLNAFAPRRMADPFLGGINLAIAYGMALIFGAFVLALFYAWLCRTPSRANDEGDTW